MAGTVDEQAYKRMMIERYEQQQRENAELLKKIRQQNQGQDTSAAQGHIFRPDQPAQGHVFRPDGGQQRTLSKRELQQKQKEEKRKEAEAKKRRKREEKERKKREKEEEKQRKKLEKENAKRRRKGLPPISPTPAAAPAAAAPAPVPMSVAQPAPAPTPARTVVNIDEPALPPTDQHYDDNFMEEDVEVVVPPAEPPSDPVLLRTVDDLGYRATVAPAARQQPYNPNLGVQVPALLPDARPPPLAPASVHYTPTSTASVARRTSGTCTQAAAAAAAAAPPPTAGTQARDSLDVLAQDIYSLETVQRQAPTGTPGGGNAHSAVSVNTCALVPPPSTLDMYTSVDPLMEAITKIARCHPTFQQEWLSFERLDKGLLVQAIGRDGKRLLELTQGFLDNKVPRSVAHCACIFLRVVRCVVGILCLLRQVGHATADMQANIVRLCKDGLMYMHSLQEGGLQLYNYKPSLLLVLKQVTMASKLLP